jgi:hypothetical protein
MKNRLFDVFPDATLTYPPPLHVKTWGLWW